MVGRVGSGGQGGLGVVMVVGWWGGGEWNAAAGGVGWRIRRACWRG